MQRTAGHISAVLRRVIYIGCGIQIVLGLCWIVCALSRALSSGKGFGECVIRMPALLCFGGVLWFFLGAFRKGNPFCRAFCVAGIMSFPMILPFLLQPDRRMLFTAFLLLEWGSLIRSDRERQEDILGKKGLLWFAAGLLFWIAAGSFSWICLAVGLIPLLVLLFRIRGKQSLRLLFAVLATAGMVTAAGKLLHPVDVLVHLADRIAWSSLYVEYDRLPLEDRKALKYDVMVETTYETDGIERVLVPSLLERRGEEGLHTVLKHMIANAWEFQRPKVLKEMVWDFAGYVMTPPVFLLQLQGRAYDSCSGVNYRDLLLPAPVLGSFYMQYSCLWFLTGIVLRVCRIFLDRIGTKGLGKEGLRTVFFVGSCFPAMVFLQALLYTLSGAGKMDYANTGLILVAWLTFLVRGCYGEDQYEEDN